MKKMFLVITALIISGCTSGTGKFVGKVIDVSWSGYFLPSCEIDVQYGDQSSKVERFSSAEKSFCDQANKLMGKSVSIEYNQTLATCWRCSSNDLITDISEVKP